MKISCLPKTDINRTQPIIFNNHLNLRNCYADFFLQVKKSIKNPGNCLMAKLFSKCFGHMTGHEALEVASPGGNFFNDSG